MATTNCIFIGHYAGADVTDAEGLIIIGDNIRDVPDGATVVIGKTICGKECNLVDILREICVSFSEQETTKA